MTPIFTASEVLTLEALYPDRDEWLFYFRLLSDRVQEDVSEEAADGIRFLCAIRQRPFRYGPEITVSANVRGKYCWCGCYNFLKREFDNTVPAFDNTVPVEVIPEGEGLWVDLAWSLCLFLKRWANQSDSTRTRLWSEWTQQEVASESRI